MSQRSRQWQQCSVVLRLVIPQAGTIAPSLMLSMIKDISISEREAECRYWLAYHYGNGHNDVILWSDHWQRMVDAWYLKNANALRDENKAPYGLACNLLAF